MLSAILDLESSPWPARTTLQFQVLYVFLVLAHDRTKIVHFNVTAHPTAEWTAQQLREAFPFEQIPRYLLRDRDRIFGAEFRKDVKAMGIKEVLSAPRSPWQRAYVEPVIGTIRREFPVLLFRRSVARTLDPPAADGICGRHRLPPRLRMLYASAQAIQHHSGEPGSRHKEHRNE
jgi:transposase InsO family protein